MGSELEVRCLGRIPYLEALEVQEKCLEARRTGSAGDVLLLLEHPKVITLGRRGLESNLRWSEEEIRAAGYSVHRVSRGGDVTLHGPGQLVGYLIMDLEARGLCDAHRYLRELETVLMTALAGLGVATTRKAGMTGVFRKAPHTREAPGPSEKLASIGIGLRGWLSYHGFALNVTLPGSAFAPIVPCGLSGVRMISVAEALQIAPTADLEQQTRVQVAAAFQDHWS